MSIKTVNYLEGRMYYTVKAGSKIQFSEFDEKEQETIKVVTLRQDATVYLEGGNWEISLDEK